MGLRRLALCLAGLSAGCTPIGQAVNRFPDWPSSDRRFVADAGELRAFRCASERCDGIRRVGYGFETSGTPFTEADMVATARRFAAETLRTSPDTLTARPVQPVAFRNNLALNRSLFRAPAFGARSAAAKVVVSVPGGSPLYVIVFVGEQTDGRETKVAAGDTMDAAVRASGLMTLSTRL